MPDGDPIVLTKQLIRRCHTQRGGITNATIRALGVPLPLTAGWPSIMVGSQISRDNYRKALVGRESYNTGRLTEIGH